MKDILELQKMLLVEGIPTEIRGEKLFTPRYILMSEIAEMVIRNFDTMCVKPNYYNSGGTTMTIVKNTPQAMYKQLTRSGLAEYRVAKFKENTLYRARMEKIQ